MTGPHPDAPPRRNQMARAIAALIRDGKTQSEIARDRGTSKQSIHLQLSHGCPIPAYTPYHARKRANVVAVGRCYECGRPDSDGYRCAACRERLNTRRRNKLAAQLPQPQEEEAAMPISPGRADLLAAGRCYECGHDAAGHYRCPACREHQSTQLRERRAAEATPTGTQPRPLWSYPDVITRQIAADTHTAMQAVLNRRLEGANRG